MMKINGEDIKALARIDKVFDKLDFVLNKVRNKNSLSDEKIISEKEKRFVANDSNYYRDYIKYKNFSLNYGFGWFIKDKAKVFVYLDFCISKESKDDKKARDLADKIKDGFNNLDEFTELYGKNHDNAISVGFKQPLSNFLKYENQENQEAAIVKKLNEWITEIKNFKDKNPELFKA